MTSVGRSAKAIPPVLERWKSQKNHSSMDCLSSPLRNLICYNVFLIPILSLPLQMQTLRLMPCLLLIPFLKQRSKSLINARRERALALLPDFCPEKKWLVLVGHQKKDLKEGKLQTKGFTFHILERHPYSPCLHPGSLPFLSILSSALAAILAYSQELPDSSI